MNSDIENFLFKQKEILKNNVGSLQNGGEFYFAFLAPREAHWKKAFNKVIDIAHESLSISVCNKKLKVNHVVANEVFSCEYEMNDIYCDVISKISDFFIKHYEFIPKPNSGYPFIMEYTNKEYVKSCELEYGDYLKSLLSYLSFISPKPLSFIYNYPLVPVSIDDLNLEYITLPDLYTHMYLIKAFANDDYSFYQMAVNLSDNYKINKSDFVNNKNIKAIRLRKTPSEILDSTFLKRFKNKIINTEETSVNVGAYKYSKEPSDKEKLLMASILDDKLPF